MNTTPRALTIGTRTSKLARWQTMHVVQRLQSAWPNLQCNKLEFVTRGDRTLDRPLPEIGGKGHFTAELEGALRAGKIDLAVHSLKDLPVEDAPGLTLGAITARADARDVVVARAGHSLATLPPGARVGTSSRRRRAQLLAARPDLDVRPIRGNVDTRVRKVLRGDYDAAILAAAGIRRLRMDGHVAEWLPLKVMLPAPGQGALAVQCRADDADTLELLATLDDGETRDATTAERAFLAALGGGCAAPIAAYAARSDSGAALQLRGLVAAQDGTQIIHVTGVGNDPLELGARVAERALQRGAEAILRDV